MNDHMQEPMRVLIADDENMQREILKIAIPWEENGFFICGEARNGVQALELCLSTKPDIMLVDVNMPLLDGLGLIEAIRGTHDHRFLPILMLTTESQAHLREKGKQLGATGWVVKPFKPEHILTVVKKIIGAA